MHIPPSIPLSLFAQGDDGSADPVWGFIGLLLLVGFIVCAVSIDKFKAARSHVEELAKRDHALRKEMQKLETERDAENGDDESIEE
jgi:hypothetical protein